MGLNRLVLHPQYGPFISLNSILIDTLVDAYDQPLENSPCIDCKLCEAVCPTGAIQAEKPFDFMACSTHCYRENMAGFQDWIDAVITADSLDSYLERFRQDETGSLWQSLMFKIQWKCGYCMAVCPAGTDAVNDYLEDRKTWTKEIVTPLKERKEPVYVALDSPVQKAAEKHKAKEIRTVVPVIRWNA
jgi:epoxyqueuosine reductase QueG